MEATSRSDASRRQPFGLSQLVRRVTVVGVAAGIVVLGGCSDDSAERADRGTESQQDSKQDSNGSTEPGGGKKAGSKESNAQANAAADLAAAKAASNSPSGVTGEPAPNDDDGARNLNVTTGKHAPESQNGSGSMAQDPLESPAPTNPAPSRPDSAGLQPLDGCDAISDPFYRAASLLNAHSSSADVRAGVVDFGKVAALADADISAPVNTLLATARAAEADSTRTKDFAGRAYQDAIVAVHTRLGDACGR